MKAFPDEEKSIYLNANVVPKRQAGNKVEISEPIGFEVLNKGSSWAINEDHFLA